MNTFTIGSLVALALIAIIWFVFVVPAERRYHRRKLELMQERIQKHEQRNAQPTGDGLAGNDRDAADG